MRKPSFLAALIGLAFAATALPVSAQYLNQSVLQKDFESADFFFRSTYLNPYGLEGFGPATAGVLIDPLLDLQLSPSLAKADSARRTWLYVDFRSARQEVQQDNYYRGQEVYALDQGASQASDYSSYQPGYYPYQSTYHRPEPILGLALFTRPATSLPGLTTGVTYQLLSSDESYYDVPDGLYRGLDQAAEAVDSGAPVVDVYSGTDQMRTTGHFASVFASYVLNPTWKVGARADFTAFDREGEFGSAFNPGFGQPGGNRQTSSQFDARTQSYRHVDLSVGVDGSLSPTTRIGGALGYLSGTADQLQDGASLYEYNNGSSGDNQNRYAAGSLHLAQIDRDGGTAYSSLFLRRNLSRGRTLTASWRGDWQSLDLSGMSTIADSSFSFSQYSGNGYENRYLSEYLRLDERTGSGTVTGVTNRLAVGLDWRLSENTTLALGAVVTHTRQETSTSESVSSGYDVAWDSRWFDGENGNENVYDEVYSEEKDLNWTLDSRRSSLQIPILLTHTLSEHFEFQAGFTRRMEDFRVQDEVLAEVASRYSLINGDELSATNLRERYRQPTEYRSTIATSALLALTAKPSPDFDVRLSVSPRRSTGYYSMWRTQWWLGFHFRP